MDEEKKKITLWSKQMGGLARPDSFLVSVPGLMFYRRMEVFIFLQFDCHWF